MTFKEKVQSMTAKEIIMNMVEGLKNPTVKIDMYTFGVFRGGICYGCAATNAICRLLGGFEENVHYIKENEIADLVEVKWLSNERSSILELSFLARFELAIDDLRFGWISHYNTIAKEEGFATIIHKGNLPQLNTRDYLNHLGAYIELANLQES